MTEAIIKSYYNDLERLATNEFEKQLLEASLKNLLDTGNKLRFNNFSCGIRELSRHILSSWSPDPEIENCSWYKNERGTPGLTSRKEKIKYAIQRGLSDTFIATFYDIDEHVAEIKDAIDILNKYTHVNAGTFNISEDDIDELSATVLDAFTNFADGIENCHADLKERLSTYIDEALIQHIVGESIDEIDILATHYNTEDIEIDDSDLLNVNSKHIIMDVGGSLNVRHQYGSDGDFARGDGAEIYSSYPFGCTLIIDINDDLRRSRYEVKDFTVDTDSWYE